MIPELIARQKLQLGMIVFSSGAGAEIKNGINRSSLKEISFHIVAATDYSSWNLQPKHS